MAIGGTGNASLFMAQNVELLIETRAPKPASGADPEVKQAGNEWVNMRQVHYIKAHPKARTDHGGRRAYGFAAPDAEVSAIVSATEDAVDNMEEYSTRDGLGNLPTKTWFFRATNSKGEQKIATFDGWMYAVEFIKRDGHPGEFADVSFNIQFESIKPRLAGASGVTGTFSAADGEGSAGD